MSAESISLCYHLCSFLFFVVASVGLTSSCDYVLVVTDELFQELICIGGFRKKWEAK